MDAAPWSSRPLPIDVVSVVRDEIVGLVDGVVASVRAESPVYADVLGGPEGVGLRLGIEQAMRAFLDAAEHGRRPAAETGELWRRLGEAEFQSGRGLDELRGAFRSGARAAWRGAAELAAGAGVSAPLVISLAEAIFVFSDELASDVVEGYVRAQSDEAGERERRRRRLAQLLLDPAGHDAETLDRAAELARWRLPKSVAAVALRSESPAPIVRRLDADALAGTDGDLAWLMVPDPDGPGRPQAIDRAARAAQVSAVLGPAVSPAQAGRSLRWARAALALAERGVIAAEPLIRVDQLLADLVVHRDPELTAALALRRLGALDTLRPTERQRLLETLAAWLDHQGHTPQIAQELSVHPQTVRYRLRRLRELLGDGLTTPSGRFELQLSLRSRRRAPEGTRSGQVVASLPPAASAPGVPAASADHPARIPIR